MFFSSSRTFPPYLQILPRQAHVATRPWDQEVEEGFFDLPRGEVKASCFRRSGGVSFVPKERRFFFLKYGKIWPPGRLTRSSGTIPP